MKRRLWPIYRQILQRSNLPILAGPWRGEVGFECLYWIPFLRKLKIAPDRLIPITRGGACVWYPAQRAIELYALRSPDAVRLENLYQAKRTGMLKQMRLVPFDRDVLRDATETLKLGRHLVLHPSWMYHACFPFIAGKEGLVQQFQHAEYGKWAAPSLPEGLALPPQFAAIKFYMRPTYPWHGETVGFAKHAIAMVSKRMPVVVLNTGIRSDEHTDIPIRDLFASKQLDPDRVKLLCDLLPITPENNLHVLSAVMARSAGFVGTYGGIAQLATQFGLPSISFFHGWQGTALAHLSLNQAIALGMGIAADVLPLGSMPMMRTLLVGSS